VDLEDRYVTSTPEGISVSLVLAGAGTRATAYLIDIGVQLAVIVVVSTVLVREIWSTTSDLVVTGIFALVYFLVTFGYFVLFETLDSGRSLGKRALGLRVVRLDGTGVGFLASLVRNLVRVLYEIPVFYLVDGGLILGTSRNQRLGDLLAGTIVVRDRSDRFSQFASTPLGDLAQWSAGSGAAWSGAAGSAATGSAATGSGAAWAGGSGGPGGWGQVQPPDPRSWLPPELTWWDATGVDQTEMAVVHAFLARRCQYDPTARRALAEQLAGRLHPKVAGPASNIDAEQFLEALAWIKSARG